MIRERNYLLKKMEADWLYELNSFSSALNIYKALAQEYPHDLIAQALVLDTTYRTKQGPAEKLKVVNDILIEYRRIVKNIPKDGDEDTLDKILYTVWSGAYTLFLREASDFFQKIEAFTKRADKQVYEKQVKLLLRWINCLHELGDSILRYYPDNAFYCEFVGRVWKELQPFHTGIYYFVVKHDIVGFNKAAIEKSIQHYCKHPLMEKFDKFSDGIKTSKCILSLGLFVDRIKFIFTSEQNLPDGYETHVYEHMLPNRDWGHAAIMQQALKLLEHCKNDNGGAAYRLSVYLSDIFDKVSIDEDLSEEQKVQCALDYAKAIDKYCQKQLLQPLKYYNRCCLDQFLEKLYNIMCLQSITLNIMDLSKDQRIIAYFLDSSRYFIKWRYLWYVSRDQMIESVMKHKHFISLVQKYDPKFSVPELPFGIPTDYIDKARHSIVIRLAKTWCDNMEICYNRVLNGYYNTGYNSGYSYSAYSCSRAGKYAAASALGMAAASSYHHHQEASEQSPERAIPYEETKQYKLMHDPQYFWYYGNDYYEEKHTESDMERKAREYDDVRYNPDWFDDPRNIYYERAVELYEEEHHDDKYHTCYREDDE